MDYKFLTKNILPSFPIVIKRAKGIKLWDKDNKQYLDFSSQTLNLNLGNSPQLVKRAFLQQFDKFTFLSSRFVSEVFNDLGKELCRISPIKPCKVNLKLNNGSDANESAFKRVRVFRNKPMIVVFAGAHIGETAETLAANNRYFKLRPFNGSRNFIHVLPPFGAISEQVSLKALEKLFEERNDIAALVLEPIMVTAGGFIFKRNFLKEVRKLCTRYNISLIFDEIQTAFGWLGTMFASDYFQVKPDIITLGKALGCGFPLAAAIMKKEYDVMDYGEDEFTYGGHPISCAIALKNIQYLQKSDVLNTVKGKSELLCQLLTEIKKKHEKVVRQIRICGLIASIEFISNEFALLVYDNTLSRGVIVRQSIDGYGPSLVIKPPIIVKDSEIMQAFNIIDRSIEAAKNF